MDKFIRKSITNEEMPESPPTDGIMTLTNESKADQLRAEIEQARKEIADIDELYAKEKRFKKAKSIIESLHSADFDSLYQFIVFDDDESFERSLTAIRAMYQSGIKDPSAGFGATKTPSAFGTKDAYEYGKMKAKKYARGKR